MVNILVPTDFSDLSKVSIHFAIKLASQLNGTVTILHVISTLHATRPSMRSRIEAMEAKVIILAEEEMNKLKEDISKTANSSNAITYRIAKGTAFNDTVLREIKRAKFDLIVMGTRGASGLKKVVMGSNTTSLIEVSTIPVLVVPELSEFNGFNIIVYATDLRHIGEEINVLLSFVKVFEASIHILHISMDEPSAREAENVIKQSLSKVGYPKFIVTVEVAAEVDKAVEAYVKKTNGDLLATFTHEHSFYDKLFDRSLTRKLAFQSKLPLLAFKQR